MSKPDIWSVGNIRYLISVTEFKDFRLTTTINEIRGLTSGKGRRVCTSEPNTGSEGWRFGVSSLHD